MRKYFCPQLVAFLVLAAGMTYGLKATADVAAKARMGLAAEVRNVLIQSCERNNDLSVSIAGVIRSSAKSEPSNLTAEDRAERADFFEAQIPKFKKIDCQAAYPKLRAK